MSDMRLKTYRAVILVFFFIFLGVLVWGSWRRSIFIEFPQLWGYLWMKLTLFDFYTGIFLFSSWVCLRERNILRSAIWIIAFVALGNLMTLFYVYLALRTVRTSADLVHFFLGRSAPSV